ncbi:hypothetical protein QJQ45_012069 [Haematococcus lacustris]|nr:hypothetical protein QJQ45_012069 [Haematococcus lacustris]
MEHAGGGAEAASCRALAAAGVVMEEDRFFTTSTEAMAPPATTAGTVEILAQQPVLGTSQPLCGPASAATAASMAVPAAKAGWRAEAARANMGVVSLLDLKAEPQDVVVLDKYVQPVDRGPSLLGSWQLKATGIPAAAAVLRDLKVERIKSGGPGGITQKACKEIAALGLDDTFYVVDLANVLRMYKAWKAAMPRVTPFYAVKCNPEPGLLRLLTSLGLGFDCASKGEVDMMLKLGVHPSRIIFAHPCKRPCDIRYAKEHGVDYTTFDTLSELHKIAALNPAFQCVLRIRADDPDARVPLGLKYGADIEDVPELLATAKQLGLAVVGVSFHVGSACQNLATFSGAIENARTVFDMAEALGHSMELLDIGGGFTGHFDCDGNVKFGDIAHTINSALAAYFPMDRCSHVRVIAEPGRYFAETSSSILTPVYGQRDRVDRMDGSVKKDYWITDGLYGSFNCILYDAQTPEYQVVRSPLLPPPTSVNSYKSTIWGPTCDSADCVYKDHELPELRNGDWLLFPNAGAYTVAGACDFNGIEATHPNKFYVFSDSAVDTAEAAAEPQAMSA